MKTLLILLSWLFLPREPREPRVGVAKANEPKEKV